MSVEQNITRNNEEFDFSQLFIAIWKHKIIVICITIIVTILTSIYSIIFLPPVYQSKLNIIINMPETYSTEFGDYTLPITTNQQYIKLITNNTVLGNTIRDMGYNNISIDDLNDRISVGIVNTPADIKQNLFEVIVSSNSPNNSASLASSLYDNYVKFLDIMTMESIVKYYNDKFVTEIDQLDHKIKSNTLLLKENEKLLSTIPQTINHEEAITDIKNKIGNNDVLILGDVSNPNYTEMEKNIISIKQDVLSDQNMVETDKNYLERLDIINQSISKYYQTNKLDSNLEKYSITASYVSLPSPPKVPSRKAGPNIVKNIAFGLFAGAIIGCITAIIKFYSKKWIKSKRLI